MTVSIEGASPETYAHHRVRGDFGGVLANRRTLVRLKRERRAGHPVIEGQSIVMKHNEHEIARVKSLAAEIGVDLISLVPLALPFRQVSKGESDLRLSGLAAYRGLSSPTRQAGGPSARVPGGAGLVGASATCGRCEIPNRVPAPKVSGRAAVITFVVQSPSTPEGVVPCRIVYDQAADTGNITQGLDSLWNNAVYQSSRAEFARRATPTLETVCTQRSIFRKPHRDVEPVRASVIPIAAREVRAMSHASTASTPDKAGAV